MPHTITKTHTPSVERGSSRFPFRPACSCGWKAPWSYVAHHAAADIAEEHARLATLAGAVR